MKIFNQNENKVLFYDDEIEKFVIYGGGEIKYFIEQNYLKEYETNKSGLFGEKYDGAVKTLILNCEIKRANKENLNRKDCYYMNVAPEICSSWKKSVKCLYIHESYISAIDDGEKVAMKTEDETNYLHAFRLVNHCGGFEMLRLKCEKVENAGKDFVPPVGCKWASGFTENKEFPNYDIVNPHFKKSNESYVIKRWSERETVTELETAQRFYCRMDESENRKENRRIAEIINENRVFYKEVSHYEIAKLRALFDLVEKTVNN